MSAECQISDCGVPALGRCLKCNRAFCLTHQARTTTVSYVDECSQCFAVSLANVKAQQQAEQDLRTRRAEERGRVKRGLEERIAALAAELRAAGSPGLQPRKMEVGQKQTIPGWTRWKPKYEAIPSAWHLGRFDWSVHHAGRSGTFESDGHTGSKTLDTYVTTDGRLEAFTDGSGIFSGRATHPVREELPAIAAAMERLTAHLLRR